MQGSPTAPVEAGHELPEANAESGREPRPRTAARDRFDRIFPYAPAALLLGLALSLVVFQAEYRHFEAVIASYLFSGGGIETFVWVERAVVVFRLNDIKTFGLEITPECSSGFLIIPFLLIGAAMLLRRRVHPGRVAFCVVLVTVLMIAANQLRIGLIAGLIDAYGIEDGYQWGHLILGSLLSILFLAVSGALMLWIVASGRRRNTGLGTA